MSQHRKFLIAIILVSVLARIGVALALGDQLRGLPGAADQLSYQTLATSLIDGHGFTFETGWWPMTSPGAPTAHWSYLYTAFLAAVQAVVGLNPVLMRIIQSIAVGVLQPLLAYLLGRRMFGEAAGLVAAALTALYAYFVYYSATLMTEPFYFTAILASLYFAIRLADHLKDEDSPRPTRLQWAVALGLVLAVAVLLRQVFLLIIPTLLLWTWIAGGRRNALFAAIPALIVGLVILPITLFNYSRFNQFVLLNTNAGFAFFWANHPIHGTSFIPAREIDDYQVLIPPELRHLNEAEMDRALLSRGLQIVRADPLRFLLLSMSRIPTYFTFWPSAASGIVSNISRVGSFGIMLPFMLLGILFWLRDHWTDGLLKLLATPGALLLAFGVVYTVVHLLSWALIRYRLPVDAVLIIFAGLAVVELSRRFLQRRIPQKYLASIR